MEVDDFSTSTFTELYRNNILECEAEGGGSRVDEFMISCGAAMQLEVGDEVYVTNIPANPYESPESCGFTGFLIR